MKWKKREIESLAHENFSIDGIEHLEVSLFRMKTTRHTFNQLRRSHQSGLRENQVGDHINW